MPDLNQIQTPSMTLFNESLGEDRNDQLFPTIFGTTFISSSTILNPCKASDIVLLYSEPEDINHSQMDKLQLLSMTPLEMDEFDEDSGLMPIFQIKEQQPQPTQRFSIHSPLPETIKLRDVAQESPSVLQSRGVQSIIEVDMSPEPSSPTELIRLLLEKGSLFINPLSNENFDPTRLQPADQLRFEQFVRFIQDAKVTSIDDLTLHDGAKVTLVAKNYDQVLKFYPNGTLYGVEKYACEVIDETGMKALFVAHTDWDDKVLTSRAQKIDMSLTDSKQEAILFGQEVNRALSHHGLVITDIDRGDNVGSIAGKKVIFDVKSLRRLNDTGVLKPANVDTTNRSQQVNKFSTEFLGEKIKYEWINRGNIDPSFHSFLSENSDDLSELREQLIAYKAHLKEVTPGFILAKKQGYVQLLINSIKI
ncbi:hypothetical protein [Shewanella surugensis]|uniref:Uncharacterized protein n=1 Tax=Shewanella surugensis TaxID=212020 RepID=A0ABT0LJ39_9GAMM|nr:hypothetical protein [Shewanella surugensis]MCL1127706.1 hypothetical protein [Shewanella surugensis]